MPKNDRIVISNSQWTDFKISFFEELVKLKSQAEKDRGCSDISDLSYNCGAKYALDCIEKKLLNVVSDQITCETLND